MEFWLPGILVLLALVFAGAPIALAMAAVGFGGTVAIIGWQPALSLIAQVTLGTGMNYTLSVVPLFVLMGNFVSTSGLSSQLYGASHAWLGHRRGGLAMATAVACGGFSAVCGSSLATAATMSKVAMPSMRRYGYADSLATGVIAAGGTLGILIPPSVILVIYGITTQSDIGQLFIAGIIPGILGILGYMAAVRVVILFNPDLGPAVPPLPMRKRFKALNGLWAVLGLFALVIGGIYVGIFTATEAAGVGAFGAFALALVRRSLTFQSLKNILVDSAITTSMMFTILIGALIFSNFMNLAGLPDDLATWIEGLNASRFAIILLIVVLYIILGAVLESLSMILLTVPLLYPIVESLGFDLIWFGILVVVVTEISLITPPIGLNVFVLKSVLPDVRLSTIFKGVMPFVLADIVRLILLILFPALVLFLPQSMG